LLRLSNAAWASASFGPARGFEFNLDLIALTQGHRRSSTPDFGIDIDALRGDAQVLKVFAHGLSSMCRDRRRVVFPLVREPVDHHGTIACGTIPNGYQQVRQFYSINIGKSGYGSIHFPAVLQSKTTGVSVAWERNANNASQCKGHTKQYCPRS
jgi:hypothetical protein